MAENENGTEKSEQATGQKLQKARDDGQVVRSKELATASVLISAALSFIFFWGGTWASISSYDEQWFFF